MKEITKEAREWVKKEIDKNYNCFDLAYHYWAYNISWEEPLSEWDNACNKAFNYWHFKREKEKAIHINNELYLIKKSTNKKYKYNLYEITSGNNYISSFNTIKEIKKFLKEAKNE